MLAYGVGLAMIGGLYVSLVYFDSRAALVFGVLAFAAMVIALALLIAGFARSSRNPRISAGQPASLRSLSACQPKTKKLTG